MIRDRIDTRIPDDERELIRTLYATGQYSQRQLARMFGRGKTTIREIIHEND